MTVYVISYDLNRPGQNYPELFEAIKACGSWWHCLTSTWMVSSSMSALDIATKLWAVMDANDKLLVNPVAKGSSWAGFTGDCESWIKNNL
ncbi:SinR family protein [Rhizobacter sp. Root404]|uniref:SinR family protein n=1 Tax=Rhizobacter sp. Root404 TaxID=1736528 RepID=UPI0009E8F780|nr:SinR family protein [Rhizobacter sp. Root404]